MMEIIPAIDLMDGACVRLHQGDFQRKTIYSDDPVAVAKQFEEAGIRRLHLVDLDGARTGNPANIEALRTIKAATSLKIDFGGGIRERKVLEEVLAAGAEEISIGSLAVARPMELERWIEAFGSEKFFLGADVKDERIVYEGWQSGSNITWEEFVGYWMGKGITRFFCTDVERDGVLKGPSTELYRRIKKHFAGIHLVASGGVKEWTDVLELQEAGLDGVIIGKAIYEHRITLEQISYYLR